jgi:hypothetical protein
LLAGLESGEIKPGPRDFVRTFETPSQSQPIGILSGWSGRLIGVGAAAVMLMGMTTVVALTRSFPTQIPGFQAPLLALLMPVPDPTKGAVAQNDVRVLDDSTYVVPPDCALVLASPRSGYAQIFWIDPGFEFEVQVFPPMPTSPRSKTDAEAGIQVESGKPLKYYNLPGVTRRTVAMVVVTPQPALARLTEVADVVIKGLGDKAHALSPQALADRVEDELRRDETLRRFAWIAIGRTTLEPVSSTVSPSENP